MCGPKIPPAALSHLLSTLSLCVALLACYAAHRDRNEGLRVHLAQTIDLGFKELSYTPDADATQSEA